MTTKDKLHKLVDRLPEAEVYAAERFLEYLSEGPASPFEALQHLPEDDEHETPEEAAAVAAARTRRATGHPGVPHDEVRRQVLGKK